MASDAAEFQRDFLKRVGSGKLFGQLFDFLPDLYFFLKDRDGLFVSSNESFMQLLGVKEEDALIGNTEKEVV